MRHVKPFSLFVLKENAHIHDIEGEDEIAIIRQQYYDAARTENTCQWDISQPGIKVFFDITGFLHKDQNLFGKVIILKGAIINWFNGKFKNSLNIVNHVGFIFSDGSVMHASNHGTGVMEELGDSEDSVNIRTKPDQYTILNLGGDETLVRAEGRKLIANIELANSKTGNKRLYDFTGIGRQAVGKFLTKWIFKERNSYQFYCSEFVANVLALANLISVNDLKLASNENLTELDRYDDIDPTKLFELIRKKGARPVNLICGTKHIQVNTKA